MKDVRTADLLCELRIRAVRGDIAPESLREIFTVARDAQARLAAVTFKSGDRVGFQGKKSGPNAGYLEGVVAQVNQKSVSVEVNTRNGVRLPFPQKWTVTASVLKLKG